MVSVIDIDSLRPGDRAAWEALARGYKAFYRDPMPDEAYEQTWRRLLDGTELHGLGARIDGTLVGIAHYFFHPTFWSAQACYLQDLFVDEAVRGRGAGRALIDGVARAARDRGATRLYWHTQEDNARARVLYDKVARFAGFIRYQYPLLRGPAAPRCWSAMARTPALRPHRPAPPQWFTDMRPAPWITAHAISEGRKLGGASLLHLPPDDAAPDLHPDFPARDNTPVPAQRPPDVPPDVPAPAQGRALASGGVGHLAGRRRAPPGPPRSGPDDGPAGRHRAEALRSRDDDGLAGDTDMIVGITAAARLGYDKPDSFRRARSRNPIPGEQKAPTGGPAGPLPRCGVCRANAKSLDQAFRGPGGGGGGKPRVERYFERQLLHTIERTARAVLTADSAYISCPCPYCAPLLNPGAAWSHEYSGLHYIYNAGTLAAEAAPSVAGRRGPYGAIGRKVRSAISFAKGKALTGANAPSHLSAWDQVL